MFRLAAVSLFPFVPSRTASGQSKPDRVVKIEIHRRKVVTPGTVIRVTEGETIDLRWTSDEAVDLHLHGYDIELRVVPGAAAVMVVNAVTTGRFPITSHGWAGGGHGHDGLAYLEVYPR